MRNASSCGQLHEFKKRAEPTGHVDFRNYRVVKLSKRCGKSESVYVAEL